MFWRLNQFKSLLLSKINQRNFIWRWSFITDSTFSVIWVTFMSSHKTFEELINFLSLFDNRSIGLLVGTELQFLKFSRIKVVFNALFLFFLWWRPFINMNATWNASVLILMNDKGFELHHILSQSACLISENVIDLS